MGISYLRIPFEENTPVYLDCRIVELLSYLNYPKIINAGSLLLEIELTDYTSIHFYICDQGKITLEAFLDRLKDVYDHLLDYGETRFLDRLVELGHLKTNIVYEWPQ
jgi:hypothetical protein